ncbi:hypothetical protein ARAM_006648, partial [Aspergillus rambellii]
MNADSRLGSLYRSLPILLTYLSICGTLAAQKCIAIYHGYRHQQQQQQQQQRGNSQRQWPSRKRKFAVFCLLALLSLGTTWYHMFCFFGHSYRSWAGGGGDAAAALTRGYYSLPRRWELWLRDRKLFREAWESVSESPERVWWSGQIFLFTVGWSLVLGVVGRKYRIPHVWSFMLIGQIVAISFAQNLFTLTVLVSESSGKRDSSRNAGNSDSDSDKDEHEHEHEEETIWTPPGLLELTPIVLSLASAAVVPSVAHTPLFMPVLLVPHFLLFVPTLLSRSGLAGFGSYRGVGRYRRLFWWIGAAAVGIQARSTFLLLSEEQRGVVPVVKRLLATMGEHPA